MQRDKGKFKEVIERVSRFNGTCVKSLWKLGWEYVAYVQTRAREERGGFEAISAGSRLRKGTPLLIHSSSSSEVRLLFPNSLNAADLLACDLLFV